MTDPVPPPEPFRVYCVAGLGATAVAVAAGLGLALDLSGHGGPGLTSTLRLVLVAAGSLAAGAAVSLRPGLPAVWLIGGVAAFLAWPGLPEHWDSARVLAKWLGILGVAAAALAAMPRAARHAALSVALGLHFFGIFLATTWPDPTPWFTQQIGTRYYLPYIQFMYLKNAYHFYSPEPGSASHLFCLIVYDKDDPKTGRPAAQWVTMPSRQHDWKDPLGLSYYRRLSLTEQASGSLPLGSGDSEEVVEIINRRKAVAGGTQPSVYPVPLSPLEPQAGQYRMPRYGTTRFLLPSYAAHLMHTYGTPERKVAAVKIYRLEHPIVNLYEFAHQKADPHAPTSFKPYYLGEFVPTADGDAVLRDKQDPMLYWLTPILPKGRGPNGEELYEDFMSKHAKYEFNWEGRVK